MRRQITWGKGMQVSFHGFLWAESQVVSRFMSAVPGGGVGETFTNLCPALGQLGEEQRAFFVSSSSRLPSPEDEPSTKAADLGAAYPAVLHTKNAVFVLEVCGVSSGWSWKNS